jgi:hypothetical protein
METTYYINGIQILQKRNYFEGKIYVIRSYKTDDIYIGSTIQPLHKRFYQHMERYRVGDIACSSSQIIQNGDAYIELIEKYPSCSKSELIKKERDYIRKNKDICVNCFSKI